MGSALWPAGAFLICSLLCSWQRGQVWSPFCLPGDWSPFQICQHFGNTGFSGSWLSEEENSTRFARHPLSPWLGGIFKATKPPPTEALPLNMQAVPLRKAGSWWDSQDNSSLVFYMITASCLYIYVKNQTLTLPFYLTHLLLPQVKSCLYLCVSQTRRNKIYSYHSFPTCIF